MVLLDDAPMGLPAASVTAPCRMSSDIVPAWANRSRAVWFTAYATVLYDIVALPERRIALAPPVSVILEPSAAPTLSLNRIDMAPLPVWYVAFTNAGAIPSYTVMLLFPVAALGYPPVPVTAPSPTCMVKDETPASRSLSASDSAAYTVPPDIVELPVRCVVLEPDVMPIFEPFTTPMSLSNCTDTVPLSAW